MSVFRLDNKVSVITGAAGSIGAAIAKLFSMQGALLFLADLEFDRLRSMVASFDTAAFPCRADLGRVSDCRMVIEKAVKQFGRLDILVNNVGICPRIPFLDATDEEWERIVAVNQRSMFFCSQAATPHLKKSKGRIVSMASYGGRAGGAANASIYSGTKGAVISLTKSLARELAPDVLVNAVAPGAIDTALVRNLPPEKIAALVETIPLKRLGTAEEVARAVLFLAADDCSYLTGATIDINGGWMMV